jgi:DegV family protein with EDD domain
MIKITADSTCDLSQELIEKYNISISPLHVLVDEDDYLDGVTITPKDLFRYVEEERKTCSTAAINTYEYEQFFKPFSEKYEAVIHISLGVGFSSCFQNANLAANEFSNVHIIDSANLSTGSGLVALKAVELAQSGLEVNEIVQQLNEVTLKVSASFVIDKMDYLKRGGRCSSIEAFGATLLKIKPSIEVKNGKMEVGKKYRGSFKSALEKYVADRFAHIEQIDKKRIFITHPAVDPEIVNFIVTLVDSYDYFEEIHVTNAGCTISSHCGPHTLGILYVTK